MNPRLCQQWVEMMGFELQPSRKLRGGWKVGLEGFMPSSEVGSSSLELCVGFFWEEWLLEKPGRGVSFFLEKVECNWSNFSKGTWGKILFFHIYALVQISWFWRGWGDLKVSGVLSHLFHSSCHFSFCTDFVCCCSLFSDFCDKLSRSIFLK